jgi:hypothetical protein
LALNLRVEAGSADLRKDGALVGVPLAGLSGTVRLVVVASTRQLTEAEVTSAARGQGPTDASAEGFDILVAQ